MTNTCGVNGVIRWSDVIGISPPIDLVKYALAFLSTLGFFKRPEACLEREHAVIPSSSARSYAFLLLVATKSWKSVNGISEGNKLFFKRTF